MSTSDWLPMGQPGHPDVFRCRVYGDQESDDGHDAARVRFIRALAGDGVIECPAYDQWLAALAGRGWLVGELEPNPDGPGRVKRWRLSIVGRRALADVIEGGR